MSKASEVFFVDFRARDPRHNAVAKVKKLFEAAEFEKLLSPGLITAIKLHFGEPGGYTHLRPVFVRAVVDKLKEHGAKPFLTDSGTLYMGRRQNAVDHLVTVEEHGFGQSVTGAPTIIADGIKGGYSTNVPIKGKHFQEVHIAGVITEAPAMVVLSHFKGHELAGFGGAIKNLAMGCAPGRGKSEQHQVHFKVDKDTCIGCGECARVCPTAAIAVREDHKAAIAQDNCIGCGECYTHCPTKAVTLDWKTEIPHFMERMTEYALGAIQGKTGRLAFINFIIDVTPDCDCAAWSDTPIVPNIGIAASTDPVALDQACWDLVNQSIGLPHTQMTEGHASGADKFAGLWPHTMPGLQISYGQELGLGTSAYTLHKI